MKELQENMNTDYIEDVDLLEEENDSLPIWLKFVIHLLSAACVVIIIFFMVIGICAFVDYMQSKKQTVIACEVPEYKMQRWDYTCEGENVKEIENVTRYQNLEEGKTYKITYDIYKKDYVNDDLYTTDYLGSLYQIFTTTGGDTGMEYIKIPIQEDTEIEVRTTITIEESTD